MTSYVVKVGGAGGLGWFLSLISRKSALISHDFNLISTDFSTRCTRFLSLPTPREAPNLARWEGSTQSMEGHAHFRYGFISSTDPLGYSWHIYIYTQWCIIDTMVTNFKQRLAKSLANQPVQTLHKEPHPVLVGTHQRQQPQLHIQQHTMMARCHVQGDRAPHRILLTFSLSLTYLSSVYMYFFWSCHLHH